MPPLSEHRIHSYGKAILEKASRKGKETSLALKARNVLMSAMAENESLRLAALRFIDVAPSLPDNDAFIKHMKAYFKNADGTLALLGGHVPTLLGKALAPLVRKNIEAVAGTFIAAETPEAALPFLKRLHENGTAFSLDLLGEAVLTKTEADSFHAAYLRTIAAVAPAVQAWSEGPFAESDRLGDFPRANVSVKLSALYEHVKPAAHAVTVQKLAGRLKELVQAAQRHHVFLNVDMEQYEKLPLTLDVFEAVLLDSSCRSYPHVGIVCQAYLKDSAALLDRLFKLAQTRKTPFSIRLVKGAYWDYETARAAQQNWPCPVFATKAETDASYEELTLKLMQAYPLVRPCFGTHNARSQAVVLAAAEACNLTSSDFEFQMLYGMAENFRDALVSMGYRVRQYCPVGAFVPGMSYLVRRLLENTANQSFLRQHTAEAASADDLLRAPLLPAAVGPDLSAQDAFLNHPLCDFSQSRFRERAMRSLERAAKTFPRTVDGVVGGTSLGATGGALPHVCPWRKELTVTTVHPASAEDAAAAVQSAKQGLNTWRTKEADERAAILEKAAELAAQKWDDLFALQVYEAGKDWLHADADIAEGIDFMRFYARQARSLMTADGALHKALAPRSLAGEENTLVYAPKGVVAVIAPWNFPFAISAGMVCAALAAGNTVVYKPAEQTSATGRALYDILRKAGVPADALHFLPGRGEEVGAALAAHEDVAMIAFTGSKEVGMSLVRTAAETSVHHIKKCVIEMGGKNALIIDDSADLDEAVPAVVHSAFGFQGQKCSACSRVFVVESVYPAFVRRLKEMVEGLHVGPPTHPEHDANAVIDEEALRKVSFYIERGKKDGTVLAQAVLSKEAVGHGHFAAPTVFTDLPLNSPVATEEIFGPVLAVFRVSSFRDALNAATQTTPYTLTGGVFTRNPDNMAFAVDAFRMGNLYLNRAITGAMVGRQPFGGGRLSGTGTKAGGADYLLNFLEPRIITENTMRRGFAPEV